MSAIENISEVLDGTLGLMGKWSSNAKLNEKLNLADLSSTISEAFDPIKSAVSKVPDMFLSKLDGKIKPKTDGIVSAAKECSKKCSEFLSTDTYKTDGLGTLTSFAESVVTNAKSAITKPEVKMILGADFGSAFDPVIKVVATIKELMASFGIDYVLF